MLTGVSNVSMSKNILTDREVIERLNQFILINIDVTEMTNEQNDLLKKYHSMAISGFCYIGLK